MDRGLTPSQDCNIKCTLGSESLTYCGSIIMRIPSFDKEFHLQHRDHGIPLSTQWFFIQSVH